MTQNIKIHKILGPVISRLVTELICLLLVPKQSLGTS